MMFDSKFLKNGVDLQGHLKRWFKKSVVLDSIPNVTVLWVDF